MRDLRFLWRRRGLSFEVQGEILKDTITISLFAIHDSLMMNRSRRRKDGSRSLRIIVKDRIKMC